MNYLNKNILKLTKDFKNTRHIYRCLSKSVHWIPGELILIFVLNTSQLPVTRTTSQFLTSFPIYNQTAINPTFK